MLRFIKDIPDHVVGIHAAGEVTHDDYKRVLIPKIDELTKRQGKIDYLLVLEADVSNFSVGAWWDDFKLGLKNFTKWNKIAVVSDQKGVEWFTDIFRLLIPGKSRGFSLGELDDAVKWISETNDNKKDTAEPHLKTPASYTDNDEFEHQLEVSSNKGQGPAGENL